MLKYEKFKKYEVDPENIGFYKAKTGEDYKFVFPNGYGASVIESYEKGLYELAVLKRIKNSLYYMFCFDSPITNDFIGYLHNDEVLKILEEIKLYEKVKE